MKDQQQVASAYDEVEDTLGQKKMWHMHHLNGIDDKENTNCRLNRKTKCLLATFVPEPIFVRLFF